MIAHVVLVAHRAAADPAQPLAGPDGADQHHERRRSQKPSGPAKRHESSRLRIFPVAVIGSEGTNSTTRVLVARHLPASPVNPQGSVLGDLGVLVEDHDGLDLLAVALVRPRR